MDVQISKESGVSLRLQVGRQISLLIATGKLKPGDCLPSVRALATRLKIHHNTVSQAYQDLAQFHLVERRPGSKMIVSVRGSQARKASNLDLDDIINSTIETAQEHGFTLQQLRQRVQDRLLAQPPDHILAVADDCGLRELIREELMEKFECPVVTSSVKELTSNPALAIGALVVGTHGNMQECWQFLPKERPPYQIRFNSAEHELALIRKLREPSTIALVSISDICLRTARGVFAPALGNRHTFREFLLPVEKPETLQPFSLVFCDSITRKEIKSKRLIHYRLISCESLDYIANIIQR